MIRVYCDEASHEPKVATVGQITEDGGGVPGRNMPSRMIGPSSRPLPKARLDSVTEGIAKDCAHRVFLCPLCGLNVTLRRENAAKVYDALAAAGVSSVRLASLQSLARSM